MRVILEQEKCNECLDCLKACPKKPKDLSFFNCLQCAQQEANCLQGKCDYGVSAGNGFVKCDLCSTVAEARCVAACRRKAISINEDALGWLVGPQPSTEKGIRIKNAKGRTIIGKKYFLACEQELTPREERMAALIIKEFQDEVKDDRNETTPTKETIKLRLTRLVRRLCEDNSILLEKNAAEKIIEACATNICGYGIIDKLLEDEELEEVSIVGIRRPIRVFHSTKGWLETNAMLCSEAYAISAINKMARSLGRRITYQNPRLNATLLDGSRLHASISPIALNGVEITIRKFKKNPLTPADLIANKTISAEATAFIWTAIFSDASLLIAGNTGSGKTTTLNALFSFIPENERIIITEETPELTITQKHYIKIISNDELGISMKDLVKDTLRMRPDRTIIGEVRAQEEVQALFDSLLSGQARGSYATFHATSAEEALKRLQSLGAREDELPAINIILVQRRIPLYENGRANEIRRVTEIAEVTPEAKAVTLFKYNPARDALEKTGNYYASKTIEKLQGTYQTNKEKLNRLISDRTKKLEKLSEELPEFNAFVKIINNP